MGIIKKQSIQSTVITYLGVVVGFFNSAIFLPMLFSSEQVGLLGFLISLTALFSTVASIGIPMITIKMFPHFRSEKTADNSFFTLTSLGTVVGIILGITVFFLFQDELISGKNTASNYPYFVITFCIVFICRLLFRNIDSYVRMLYNTVLGIALEGFFSKLIILCGLISVFFFRDIPFDWVFITYGFALTLPGIVMLVYILTKNVRLNTTQFISRLGTKRSEMLSVGFFGLVGGLSAVIVLEIDRIMLSNMLGLSANGVYSVAFFFGVFISIPSRGLKRIAAVIISDSLEKNDMENIQNVYQKSCINQLLIAGYLFLGIWFCIDYVFEFMKPEYATGKYVVLFIGLAQLVDMATGVNAEIINISKNYRYNTYFSSMLIVLVVGLNYIFIPTQGITGAAFASFVSILIINILRTIFLYKRMGLNPFTSKMGINTLLIVGIFILISLLPKFNHPILGILISGSIITILYWTIAYWLTISEDISNTIQKILFRFTKR